MPRGRDNLRTLLQHGTAIGISRVLALEGEMSGGLPLVRETGKTSTTADLLT